MVSTSPETFSMVQVVTLELRYLKEVRKSYFSFSVDIGEMKPALESQSLSLPARNLHQAPRSGWLPGQLAQDFLLH